MRFTIFCAVMLTAVQIATAQITVLQPTMESMFSVGNPITLYFGTSPTDTTVDVGQQGGPHVYDFSTVSFTLFKIDTVKQVSTIPYLASRFPGSAVTQNFAAGGDENNHNIWVFANDQLRNVGQYEQYNADSILVVHEDPYDIFMQFPIQFGGTTSITVSVIDSVFSGGVFVSDTASTIPIYTVVDGWGTLKLPGEPDRPCLRIRWYEDPEDFHAKSFRFVTNDGLIININTRNDQPDEGIIEFDGEILLFRSSTVTSVSESAVPASFTLHQNYPNPFNPSSTIQFSIPSFSFVTLKIYNLLGKEITTLVSENLTEGHYSRSWNAEGMPSGIYYYRLTTRDGQKTKTLVFTK